MIPNAIPPNIPPAIAATLGEVLLLLAFVFELVCAVEPVAVSLALALGTPEVTGGPMLVRVTPPATKEGEGGSESATKKSAEIPVPGGAIFTFVSSGWVRINASTFIELFDVSLVLVTVIVYVSVISSLSLLKRTACARVSIGRNASDCTDIRLPRRGWRVIGMKAGEGRSLIPYPT
jgi:hypothetical protein